MKRISALTVLGMLGLMPAAASAQKAAWPHTGKYGFGTRYYYIHNYLKKDLTVEFVGNGQPKATFPLKAGHDTLYEVINTLTSSRIWAYWDASYKGPFTLAECSLHAGWGSDWYNLSLVDGYNMPMVYKPVPGTFYPDSADLDRRVGRPPEFSCGVARCISDLYLSAPAADLTLNTNNGVSDTVGFHCQDNAQCRSLKKTACPTAYSYDFDDAASLFTCPSPNLPSSLGDYAKVGPDYEISFGLPPATGVAAQPTVNHAFIDALSLTLTTKGELKYAYGGDAGNAKLALYSSNGKLLAEAALKESFGILKAPELSPGLYFVRLSVGDAVQTAVMRVKR